jgi:hypothetical protein
MKKKLQFFVVYSLNGGDAYALLSVGVDVEVPIDANAVLKSKLILEEIVRTHNNHPSFYKQYGYIRYEDVIVRVITRLD